MKKTKKSNSVKTQDKQSVTIVIVTVVTVVVIVTFLVQTTQHLNNRCDVLRAAFCDSHNVCRHTVANHLI